MACKYQLPLVVVIVYFTTAAYGRDLTCSVNSTYPLTKNKKYHTCFYYDLVLNKPEESTKIEDNVVVKDMILNGSVVLEGDRGFFIFIPREDFEMLEDETNEKIKQEVENTLLRFINNFDKKQYYLTTHVPVLKPTKAPEVEETTAASQGVSLPLVLAILLAMIAFVGIGSYMYCKTSKQAATSVKGSKTSDKKNSAGPKTTEVSESQQNNTATRSEVSEDSNFKSTDGTSS